ncbi:MAG: TIGR00304 family membrane protein [Candidatus Bathyarchaeia archaeon]
MVLALGGETLYELGIIIILVGVIIVFAAFVLLFLSSIKGGKARGGGALIIGPFPIVFGSDKESVKTILWLSIALTLLLFVVFIVLYLLGG